MSKKHHNTGTESTPAQPVNIFGPSSTPAETPVIGARVSEKRVISFALYGRHPMYVNGAIENAKRMPEFYPGWEMWFYVGSQSHPTTPARLKALGATVIMMDDSRLPPWGGKFWRMLPLTDSTVDVCAVRDVDSRPSKREQAAVEEWLASGKAFHIMRDHKLHTSPVMGGMWAARKGFVTDFKKKLNTWLRGMESGVNRTKNWSKNGRSDQGFLGNVIWPNVQGNYLAHDNWKRLSGDEKPFMVQPPAAGMFVGQVFDHNSRPIFNY